MLALRSVTQDSLMTTIAVFCRTMIRTMFQQVLT